MPRFYPREIKREFWLSVRSGESVSDAAAGLGVHPKSGALWVRETGGVTPDFVTHPPQGRFLSIDERERILVGVDRGDSIRQIARDIGRHPSSVQRELRRNMGQRYRPKLADGTVKATGAGNGWRSYRPHVAQRNAESNASRPKVRRLARNDALRMEVQKRLTKKHSPEQISNRLREDFPNDPEMRVSHEAIYQSIYVQGRGALKRDLAACLRTGRALRKPQRRPEQRRARVLGMVNISERPAEAEDRAVPGHWEGDLITGENNASAIGTLVERSTGYLMLLHLPERHGALEVQEAMIPKISQLPDSLRRSLTWDQGIEMANHVKIAKEADIEIYFCDPHSPWQRGSNENTNGLLRQYFPKSTDLSGYHPDYLDFVADQLNTRPRKRLGWKTPAEALAKLLNEPIDPPGVALTA
jgi:IS30 family transposase